MGDDDHQQDHKRKYTTWEDIGLVEYNQQTEKWEFRFEHCQLEMVTERLTNYTRNKQHPEHNIGKANQELTSPYCNKTYRSQEKLLMRIELAPQKGNRNVAICLNMHTEDAPKELDQDATLDGMGHA